LRAQDVAQRWWIWAVLEDDLAGHRQSAAIRFVSSLPMMICWICVVPS
jgi:hypothetical protein